MRQRNSNGRRYDGGPADTMLATSLPDWPQIVFGALQHTSVETQSLTSGLEIPGVESSAWPNTRPGNTLQERHRLRSQRNINANRFRSAEFDNCVPHETVLLALLKF